MMISGSERLSKTDRYSSGSLFGLFRSVTLRSRSLENVSDRSSKKENDQRRRRRKRGEDEEEGAGGGDGHEYPYAMKMKHLQSNTTLTIDHDDGHLINSSPSTHHSSASLNQISMKSHDFELRKRDFASNEHLAKKLRFFHKRKTKDLLLKSPLQAVSLTDDYFSSRTHRAFFGEPLDQLIKRHDDQLPPVIQQLLEVLYYKGPETIGIFRKVANTRSVKESIEKIERNLPLVDEELHPILAAGIFKHFLRTLPSPIFSAEQYDQWKKCLRLANSKEKVHFARTNIIPSLSESNHLLLKAFICVLNRISQNAETNGMNPFNLGLCVSNSLFKTESTNISSGKQEADVMSSIVEFLILNCSSLFDADVLNCIAEKRLSLRTISHRIAPSASSIESLDEVESSPHLPVVNRSRDSGLATSDQPLNDDSSEVSEHIRRQRPDWSSAVSFGKGTVLTSIFLPSNRGRTMKNLYKPSKQFLEREKFTIDTTDDSDHDRTGDSSVRSSNTTVNNLPIGKLKRSKPICRQSSLGSSEYQQQQQQQQSLTQESKRTSSTHHDVKRTSSLKQFHHSSDEGDAGDEQTQTKKKSNCINVKKSETTNLAKSNSIERRGRWNKSKSSRTTEEEAVMTTNRHGSNECQDLDLLHEPLSNVNPRLICSNVSSNRSASFNVSALSTTPLEFYPRPSTSNLWSDGRSRHNGPLAATTNQIYQSPQPLEDLLSSHHRCRPCHRQNALRYKSIDPSPEKSPRYSSVERRSTSRKSASFDIHDELRPTDISWSVKEKAKLFEEHPPVSTRKFSTGRENYV